MTFLAEWTGQRAMSAHRKGKTEEALALYRRAFSDGLTNTAALKSFSSLLVRRGEFDEALQVLKRADSGRELSLTDKNDLYANYAIVLWKKGRVDHAVQVLQERLKEGKSALLYSVLGYLAIEKGDADLALAVNREALEYDSEDPVFLDNMAQTCYRLLGDREEAERYFRLALQHKPAAIDTNYFLALIEGARGEKAKALERLETASKGNFSPLNYATPARIEDARRAIEGGDA